MEAVENNIIEMLKSKVVQEEQLLAIENLTRELKINNYITAAFLYTDRYGCCTSTDKKLKTNLSNLMYRYESEIDELKGD